MLALIDAVEFPEKKVPFGPNLGLTFESFGGQLQLLLYSIYHQRLAVLTNYQGQHQASRHTDSEYISTSDPLERLNTMHLLGHNLPDHKLLRVRPPPPPPQCPPLIPYCFEPLFSRITDEEPKTDYV